EDGLGFRILIQALERPIRTLAENAGVEASRVTRRVLKEKKTSFGFNALSGEYGDMFEMGIVDPAKVTRTALENAVSVAATLMTTDCLVTEAPKKEKNTSSNPDEDYDDEY
ncbi:MAG: TCP-1/cpn60 chaperonin family protein, partial [Planctomycetota bacterium]